MQQHPVEKRSFSVDEFIARHSISRSQVYVEIRSGRLPARKIGARTVITIEDEECWLNSLPPLVPGEKIAAA